MTLINTETGEIVDTINYEVHPVAALFPYIEGDAFREFVEDIRKNGQREPVVLDVNGRLLDGRNRARACQALGIDVNETRYSGDDAEAWIISHNVHRRHLTTSQRAMIAGRLADMRKGERTDLVQKETKSSTSIAEAASRLDVSRASAAKAKAVINSGDTGLIKAVESGALTVAAAEAQVKGKAPTATPPPTKQPAVDRAAQIGELADQGYSSRQIAERLAIGFEQVRKIAREYDIDVPADKAMARTKRHNSAQIAENTVTALEGLAMGLSLINFDEIETHEAADWAASLKDSLSALNRFHKKIKETAQ